MCLISLESHQRQFSRILDRLYVAQTSGVLVRAGMTLEKAVNRILFSMPAAPVKVDHLTRQVPKKPKYNPEGEKGPPGGSFAAAVERTGSLTQVLLSNSPEDMVVFKAESPFDLFCSQNDLIANAVQRLSLRLILTLYQRQLFNTCSILRSPAIE
jgi:hypothetical protein